MKVDSRVNSKVELRRSLLTKRRSLLLNQWQQNSDRICVHLQSSSLFNEAKTILAYFSFRQEPDLTPLFSSNRRWGFSRCVGKSLVWHLWKPGEGLQCGSYGIREPYPDAPAIALDEVDLILIPAVACDRRGYRLGYGGGYYDRLLCDLHKPAIGIVFEFAYLPNLPIDNWDIPLTAVCTESGLNTIS